MEDKNYIHNQKVWYTAESHRISNRGNYHRNKVKYFARVVVRRALKSGKLVKGPCEFCGATKVVGHHDSYERERWLDVRWMCHKCHMVFHRGRKNYRSVKTLTKIK
jgi:ribosomal protein S27AE